MVDHHAIVREGVRRLLAHRPGLEVVEAPSAHEAAALFRSERPDLLVLLDLNLPNESGLALLRQLGEGKTLVAIASALGVSCQTVANACTLIKSKLGAERVTDLIRMAIELRDC